MIDNLPSFPPEIRHHFGCCRQTVTFPLDQSSRLAELVGAHECPFADADELPPPVPRRRPRDTRDPDEPAATSR